MKETPLILCGEMVRATLAELKTNTRRITGGLVKLNQGYYKDRISKVECRDGFWCFWEKGTGSSALPVAHFKCPYGQSGDRLWVRETYYCDHYAYPDVPENERADVRELMMYYAADGDVAHQISECEGVPKLRTPIFMPRWASRITLEVTGVRVERLQDISETDARDEGIELLNVTREDSHRFHYRTLWDSLNRKTFPWSSNPWVWVIQFNKL